MNDITGAGVFRLGDRTVKRLGYGAMQLAGPNAFGPPKDRQTAIRVLREAVEAGVNHIDTSDYYGPRVTNEIIAEALRPYPEDLTIVTKVGARRDEHGAWIPAHPEELRSQVQGNLRALGVERLDVVNFRCTYGLHTPTEGSIAASFSTLVELQREGLIRHLGVSNATAAQVAEARALGDVVCVQNHYNLVHRDDDAMLDDLAAAGIAYVPYFPLGGFAPLQSSTLSAVAERLGATPMQVALAWLLRRAPNVLLIPGTSSPHHLRENLAVAELHLADDALAELDAIAPGKGD